MTDFTIGDFWGIQDVIPQFFDDKGTSVVLTHNDRAVSLLNEISDSLEICEVESSILYRYNTPIVKSVPMNSNRNEFLNKIDEKIICKELKRYTSISYMRKLKYRIKKLINR